MSVYRNWRRARPAPVGAVVLGLLGTVLVAACLDSSSTRWTEDRTIPFSPDDRAIAYTHRDTVYVARTQGDDHRRVFRAREGELVSTPHWAPGRRGIAFAVTDRESEADSARIRYTIYYWPAPESIWAQEGRGASDTADLPAEWTPARTETLVSATAGHSVQVAGDALFEWHPDGEQILYLDAAPDGQQSLHAFSVDDRTSRLVSPVRATSLAFALSPDGESLHVAAEDAGSTALWFGPLDDSRESWRQIEDRPGPEVVPRQALPSPEGAGTRFLFDLRPRLGAWSPDSRWLAHTRLPPGESGDADAGGAPPLLLVITDIQAPGVPRLIELAGADVDDLHWRPGSRYLGLASDQQLRIVDAATAVDTELAGTLGVEGFVGWSETDDYLAYLVEAENFDATRAMLPDGSFIAWQPARRHNLMVAGADGTSPRSRFGLMNIEAAQWASQSAKLSFWATYLPTVSLLPPGDPAATLDVVDDSLHWFPTDIAEFAHVGHYYLLNARFDEAQQHYADALHRMRDADREEFPDLERELHMWHGVALFAAGDTVAASTDFQAVRDTTRLPDTDAEPGVSTWNARVLGDLVADRDILSTMISMGLADKALDYTEDLAAADADARYLQSLCYRALVFDSLGRHDLYVTNIVEQLLPALMRSAEVPITEVDALVGYYADAAAQSSHSQQLSRVELQAHADALGELHRQYAARAPERAAWLARAAMSFYRDAGDLEGEKTLLSEAANLPDPASN